MSSKDPMSSRDPDGSGTDPAQRLLEPSPAEMRRMVDSATTRILDHLGSLPSQRASDLAGVDALVRELAEDSLPEHGEPLPALLDLLFDQAIPKSFNSAGPGYLGYIPGGGIFPAAVADLISGSVNRYLGIWQAAPCLAQLEGNVVRWFCRMVGFTSAASGFLTSGASLAGLSAVFTARRKLLPEDFLHGVLYTSDQTHHSVSRAAVLAGFPPNRVREIPSDDHCRLRIDRLRRQIREDRAAGLQPFLVVANAGTTNSGAVDDLPAAAQVAQEESLWLHVDAAYGGFFLLTGEGQKILAGIEQADSVALDPHKSLFLPYGTGCLLVRDGNDLRSAHRLSAADYLPETDSEDEIWDFHQLSPELTRPFRGLRVWLPLKLYGAEPFRQALEEKLELTRWICARLRDIPHLQIVAEPQLTTLAFRMVLPGLAEQQLDRLNQRLLEAVVARGRVFLSGTRLKDRFVSRITVLSFRTHQEQMELALEDIRQAAQELAMEEPPAENPAAGP